MSQDTVVVENFEELALFQHQKIKETDYLILHNKKLGALQFISLNGGGIINPVVLPNIPLPNEQTNSLKSFYFYKPDSIFLLFSFSLTIIDTSGQVKFNKIINAPEKQDWPSVVYGNFLGVFPIYYDAVKRQLLLRQHCGPCGNAQSFFDTNVLAIYEFASDSFIDAKIPFPESYKQNYLGDAILVLREIKNDSVIFNFQADPTLLIFSRAENKIFKREVKSNYHKSNFVPLDTAYRKDINRRSEHIVTSPLYLKVIYDTYRHVYYRLFLEEINLKNADGTYNDFHDKQLVVMVLDENLNLLSEKRLGNGYLWNYSFVTEKGLYIMKNDFKTYGQNGKNFSKILFEVVSINYN